MTGDETLKNTLLERIACLGWNMFHHWMPLPVRGKEITHRYGWTALHSSCNPCSGQGRETLPLYTIPPDAVLRIEFHSTAMNDVACLMPGVKRLDGRVIEYQADDMPCCSKQ